MRIAQTFFSRFLGAMGKSGYFKPIHFPHCNKIHTCFMRQNIHLDWLDSEGRLIKRIKQARPWRIYGCPEADSVIEYPQDYDFKIPYPLPHSPYPKFLRDESGQSLVEFALLLPIIILLIFGFFQLSLAIHANLKLQHVTFYATHVGALSNNDEKIIGAIESFYDEDEIQVTIENKNSQDQVISSSDRRYGDTISVELKHEYPIAIPYLTLTHLNLTNVASMRILCQNQRSPYTCE